MRQSTYFARLLVASAFVVATACPAPPPQESAEIDVTAVSAAETPVVYGVDGRRDAWELNAAERAAVDNHVITMFRQNQIVEMGNTVFAEFGDSLADGFGVCPDERFTDQSTAGQCSATLIADQLVLTAGHCEDAVPCFDMSFLFNYSITEAGDQVEPVTSDDRYDCAQVLYSVNNGNRDWAVIELDRPVVGHTPATFVAPGFDLNVDDPIVLMGSPSGLPTKVDATGVVRDPDPPGNGRYFFGTPDAFGGNSGSGVYTEDLELVGVLTFGEQDYVFDMNAGCTRVNTLLDDGPEDGEGIMYARQAIQRLCEDFPEKAPTLCGIPETCASCNPDDPAGCAANEVCISAASDPDVEVNDFICTTSCGNNQDCAPSFLCDADGLCRPRAEATCLDETVFQFINACGIEEGAEIACLEPSVCQGGACVDVNAGQTCDFPISIPAADAFYSNDTTGTGNDDRGFCGGDEAPEQVYSFTLEQPALFTAETTGFDTLIYLRANCDAQNMELACDDDDGPNTGSRIEVNLGPGTYFLFVDGWGEFSVGNYNLSVSFTSDTPCEMCSIGETRCGNEGADGFLTCNFIEEFQCNGFTQFTFCDGDENCNDGVCQSDCVDECPFESPLCIDENTAGFCGQLDADPCLDLTVAEFCQPGSVCVDFFCVEECTDDCEEGDQRCFMDAAEETCVYIPELDCTRWELGQICSPPEGFCSDGECFGCDDGCDLGEAPRCADSGSVEACVFDQNGGCSEWSVIETCGMGETCSAGVCSGEQCVDECPGQAATCNENDAIRCELGPEGCFELVVEFCGLGSTCDNGICLPDACDAPECTVGDTQCTDDNAIRTCVVDGEGCVVWLDGTCPNQGECDDGVCVDGCEGVCTLGDTRCTNDGRIEACVVGGDCTIWSAPSPCPGGGACLNDQCVGECADQCTPGESLCVNDHAYRSCVDVGSCAVWGTPQYCFDTDVCQNAACVTPPPVADAGPVILDAGYFDTDSPERIRVIPTQNCDQSGGAASAGLWGLLLIGLARRARRRRPS